MTRSWRASSSRRVSDSGVCATARWAPAVGSFASGRGLSRPNARDHGRRRCGTLLAFCRGGRFALRAAPAELHGHPANPVRPRGAPELTSPPLVWGVSAGAGRGGVEVRPDDRSGQQTDQNRCADQDRQGQDPTDEGLYPLYGRDVVHVILLPTSDRKATGVPAPKNRQSPDHLHLARLPAGEVLRGSEPEFTGWPQVHVFGCSGPGLD